MSTDGTSQVKMQGTNLAANKVVQAWYTEINAPFASHNASCTVFKTGTMDSKNNDLDFLVCTTEPGVGTNYQWNVIIDDKGVMMQHTLLTSYASPEITTISSATA